jgi:D-glycero-alpha-D-manno-heptose-7-phosphate kinase
MDTRKRQLRIMRDLVDEGLAILGGQHDIGDFGALLNEAWQAKRSLSGAVSNPEVDGLYERARAAGAIGGKLTGAGGGGFLLLFARPAQQQAIREELSELINVPFKFDFSGSQIIHYEPDEDYTEADRTRSAQALKPFRR